MHDVDVTANGGWVDDADGTHAYTHTSPSRGGAALLSISLYVLAGRLSLHTTEGLNFTVGDGAGDVAMAFTGTLVDISDALVRWFGFWW